MHDTAPAGDRVQQLQTQLHALVQSNESLEQFACIASHELQEPLRVVTGFAQLLQRRYAIRLDDVGREAIGAIVENVNHLLEIISGLLTLSRRLTPDDSDFAAVDCEHALTTAVNDLQLTIAEKAAVISHETLPMVFGDALQITRVFRNLLSNGLKFCTPGVTPEIHAEAQRLDGMWRFAFRDNGVGMTPEQLSRLFVMFSRVHGKQFSGTGIGLAISRRIVERHGGKIWAESEPGKGSTFYFTITDRRST